MFAFLFHFIFLVSGVLSMLFVVRLLLAPLSKKICGQIRRHPLLHLLLGILTLCYGLFLIPLIYPGLWPPHWLELKRQRKVVLERIQEGGGWTALRADCLVWARTNSIRGFHQFRPATNELPRSIAKLRPVEIWSDPGPASLEVIHIRIFGIHSSGGHSTPYYGLEVLCGTNSQLYLPPSANAAKGNSHFHSHKISEDIYEIY